jgi:hypothetical protein
MRIAGEACRPMAGYQEFGKFRMTFVKFDIVGSDLSEKGYGLLVVFVFLRGEPYENFDVPRFRDELAFPLGSAKSSKDFGSSSFLTRLVFHAPMKNIKLVVTQYDPFRLAGYTAASGGVLSKIRPWSYTCTTFSSEP